MPRELVGQDDIEKLCTYQPPTPETVPHFQAVAKACEAFIRAIKEHVPASADRTVAIRHALDARMTANMAITLDGQNLIPRD